MGVVLSPIGDYCLRLMVLGPLALQTAEGQGTSRVQWQDSRPAPRETSAWLAPPLVPPQTTTWSTASTSARHTKDSVISDCSFFLEFLLHMVMLRIPVVFALLSPLSHTKLTLQYLFRSNCSHIEMRSIATHELLWNGRSNSWMHSAPSRVVLVQAHN
jgi:hypothetical protein